VALAHRLQQDSGIPVEPLPFGSSGLAGAVSESARAAAAVVGVGKDWSDGDFGEPAAALAVAAECPVFVVRARYGPAPATLP
jgi:hypothetical protein